VTRAARALIALALTAGCALGGSRIAMRSQLQVREFQTRTYDSKDTAMVMKAVLNVLQDDGFIIKTSNVSLGEMTASKERSANYWALIFLVRRVESWECSVNVTDFGEQTKVRVNVQTSMKDALGNVLYVHEVDDPIYYRDFFTKVDKGVFIQKEKL